MARGSIKSSKAAAALPEHGDCCPDGTSCVPLGAIDDQTGFLPMAAMAEGGSIDSIDMMFRAFSDRTRLRILHALEDGELCVGDIVEILQVPQPRASRHLGHLRKANLVTVRKAGLWSFYSLAQARTPFHEKLLECLANCFRDVREIQGDSAGAEKIRESGGCCPTE